MPLSLLLLALPVAGLLAGGAALYTPDLPPAALEARYAVEPSRFAEVDGLRIHYRDEGSGPAILLVHGLTASLFDWDAWAAGLRGHHRVIRLDLPGHGLTGPDPLARYGWAAMGDLALRLLDRLEVERATVAGSSLGGAVAWQLAARHPERVERLVLLAPLGYPLEGRPPLALRLLAHPVAGPLLARLTYRRAFMARLAAGYGDPDRLNAEAAERQFALFRRAGNRDALRAMLRGGLGTPMPDPRPLLARIQAPTLILWGTADRLAPPALAARFARDIDGARVALIEGVGHVPMIEAPAASLVLLERFLAR